MGHGPTSLRQRPYLTVVVPDVHVPWHSVILVAKLARLLRDIKPDRLILGGDFLDLYTLAKFNEGSLERLRGLTLTEEYAKGRKVLEAFQLPGVEKHYLYGNHEDRYLRFLASGDTAKLGAELIAPEDALRLEATGWHVYRDWQNDGVEVGPHLQVIHGNFTTDHASKKHLDAYASSVIFGHTHRWGAYVNGQRGGYNIGFLGDRNSPGFAYASRCTRQRWVNGFALVYTFDDGTFLVTAVQCWSNRFVVNGRAY